MIHLRLFNPQGCSRRESPTYGQNPCKQNEVHIHIYKSSLSPFLLYGYARRTPTQSLYDMQLTSLEKFHAHVDEIEKAAIIFCSWSGATSQVVDLSAALSFKTSATSLSRIVSFETSTCFDFGHWCFSPRS